MYVILHYAFDLRFLLLLLLLIGHLQVDKQLSAPARF